MKIITQLVLLIACLLLNLNLRGETVTLLSNGSKMQSTSSNFTQTYSVVTNQGSATATVTVGAGEVVRVVSVYALASGQHQAKIKVGTATQGIWNGSDIVTFVGPGSVALTGPTYPSVGVAFITLEIRRAGEESSRTRTSP